MLWKSQYKLLINISKNRSKLLKKVTNKCLNRFFQIADLQHSVISPTSFRLEYKRGSATPTAMFQRQVRMQVDISHISKAEAGPEALYAITFTLLSGNYFFFIIIILFSFSLIDVSIIILFIVSSIHKNTS